MGPSDLVAWGVVKNPSPFRGFLMGEPPCRAFGRPADRPRRYLGDLSGGQLLRRAAVRGMKLPEDGSGAGPKFGSGVPSARFTKREAGVHQFGGCLK